MFRGSRFFFFYLKKKKKMIWGRPIILRWYENDNYLPLTRLENGVNADLLPLHPEVLFSSMIASSSFSRFKLKDKCILQRVENRSGSHTFNLITSLMVSLSKLLHPTIISSCQTHNLNHTSFRSQQYKWTKYNRWWLRRMRLCCTRDLHSTTASVITKYECAAINYLHEGSGQLPRHWLAMHHVTLPLYVVVCTTKRVKLVFCFRLVYSLLHFNEWFQLHI